MGLPHVDSDESCVGRWAVRDESFQPNWSCPVIHAVPQDDNRKSQHLFQRAKREKNTSPCFWSRGTVPAEWMEVPAPWDAVEPRVKHNSCHTLKEWAKNNCLICSWMERTAPFSVTLFLVAAAGVWQSSISPVCLAFDRGGSLPGAKQTVATQDPLILVSHNGYFLSTAQRGRANPVGPCSDLWHQCWWLLSTTLPQF